MDAISEMITGEKGAVKCIGKFYIMPTSKEIKGMPLTLVAGSVVSPCGGKLVLPENERYSEMWECEIIIIPKRKFSGTDGTFHPFLGYRIDRVLTSNFGDPNMWGKEYFEKTKQNDKGEQS